MTIAVATTRGRRAALPPSRDPHGADAISAALDYLAHALEVTGNRKLLPIFERLERELDALEGDDATMKRALRRTKKGRRRG